MRSVLKKEVEKLTEDLGNPPEVPVSLVLRVLPKNVIDYPLPVTIIAVGTVDVTVDVYCHKPDKTLLHKVIKLYPARYKGWDAKAITFPAEEINLGGAYVVFARTEVEGVYYWTPTTPVVVEAKVETRTYTLLKPNGEPIEEGHGHIVLFHKPSGAMAWYATDAEGKVTLPIFDLAEEWAMYVRWRNVEKPEEFDLEIYDPLRWEEVPTELKAEGWFTTKHFEFRIHVSREKFVDYLSIKNPLLGKLATPAGSFIDVFPRHAAMIVANELIGALPFLRIADAHYDSKYGILSIMFEGYVEPMTIAMVIAIVLLAGGFAFSMPILAKIPVEMYRAKAARHTKEAVEENLQFKEQIAKMLAEKKLTKDEAALLLGQAVEFSEKWAKYHAERPPVIPPALIWIILLIIIGVFGFFILRAIIGRSI